MIILTLKLSFIVILYNFILIYLILRIFLFESINQDNFLCYTFISNKYILHRYFTIISMYHHFITNIKNITLYNN